VQHKVYLIGGGDDEFGVFDALESEGTCRLQFVYRDKAIEENARDFFEALCKIRLHMEKDTLIPFCYGASLNVYPSGMARDMASGLKAYKMQLGKHVSRQDLVHIFAEGPDVIPASVAHQRAFFEQWLAGPRA